MKPCNLCGREHDRMTSKCRVAAEPAPGRRAIPVWKDDELMRSIIAMGREIMRREGW